MLFPILVLSGSSSCSLYKSDGRKTFETQSPSQIRSLSLVDCNEKKSQFQIQNSTESNSYYELEPLLTYETQWTPEGHEVRVSEYNQKIHAQVEFSNKTEKQICTYQAQNLDSWLLSRDIFFTEIDALVLD